MRLNEIIPDAEALLSLEPEELAGAVLAVLNSKIDHDGVKNHFYLGKHTGTNTKVGCACVVRKIDQLSIGR